MGLLEVGTLNWPAPTDNDDETAFCFSGCLPSSTLSGSECLKEQITNLKIRENVHLVWVI